MLVDFIERIAKLGSTHKGVKTVYFSNFSRFDLLMKFLASHMVEYTIKPLMRNKKLYQLEILRKKGGIRNWCSIYEIHTLYSLIV